MGKLSEQEQKQLDALLEKKDRLEGPPNERAKKFIQQKLSKTHVKSVDYEGYSNVLKMLLEFDQLYSHCMNHVFPAIQKHNALVLEAEEKAKKEKEKQQAESEIKAVQEVEEIVAKGNLGDLDWQTGWQKK